jgi:hypothetical protein
MKATSERIQTLLTDNLIEALEGHLTTVYSLQNTARNEMNMSESIRFGTVAHRLTQALDLLRRKE